MREGLNEPCRCGWTGVGEHPCHGLAYTCRKPGKDRYYEPHKLYSLAGSQMKLSVTKTTACDECWGEFTSGRRK